MAKKSTTRILPAIEFRESDFAGMKPADQAQLSGSLNRLSEKLALSRQLLLDLDRPARVSGLHAEPAPPGEGPPPKRPK